MRDDKHPLLIWAKNKLSKNQNIICVFTGPTGSGKTYAALDLCLTLSRIFGTDFSLKKNMSFEFEGMLKKMMLEENKKPGTCFLFEEVGVLSSGGSSASWQSELNKFFHSFLQTSRHRNQVLVMTVPNFAFIAKGIRMLVHMVVDMGGINPQAKESWGFAKLVSCQNFKGEVWMKWIRYRIPGENMTRKLVKTYFSCPVGYVLEEYEMQKTEYTNSLYNDMIGSMNEANKSTAKPIEKRDLNIYIDYMITKDLKGLSAKYNLSDCSIYRIVNEVKRGIENDEP